ncbi:hypothetical protein KFL_001000150 [Klebsormidium nitens]|uniref:Methyltransferase type 11 domain-containing protein n=1 Tax=Klebsormidium nitens TaxID=105231 RepID=A0A1Y1HVA4_KLENI|nr:hypothetical protein KFL_001000150 [Klebsormidium nitens]|eukprot:GAQ82093.1 hypothetical protein KFL_001000150 [Klebsormidium nitens]
MEATTTVKQNREWGDLEQPDWSGDSLLSKVINTLIGIKPLYSLMKAGARRMMISTAEKNGVPWRRHFKELETSDVYKELELIEDKSILYPDYYLQPFHAYDRGNLCWQAAFEVDSASASMVLRGVPQASSVDEANAYLRGNWLERIREHHEMHSGGLPVKRIVDVGCATGISTRFLANKFGSAEEVLGLDLSPYFLSVAQFRDRQAREAGQPVRPIQWMHKLGENTGLPDDSVDIVSLAFVLHECPNSAARDLIQEAKRILRPGGTIAIIDNSPRSKIIQSLPAPVYTLMKSTEPWSDEFYGRNLARMLSEAGFKNVEEVLTDARHSTMTGTAC